MRELIKILRRSEADFALFEYPDLAVEYVGADDVEPADEGDQGSRHDA